MSSVVCTIKGNLQVTVLHDPYGSILQRENVGYELLAVKAIFRMYWPDLQRCIAVANEVGSGHRSTAQKVET